MGWWGNTPDIAEQQQCYIGQVIFVAGGGAGGKKVAKLVEQDVDLLEALKKQVGA